MVDALAVLASRSIDEIHSATLYGHCLLLHVGKAIAFVANGARKHRLLSQEPSVEERLFDEQTKNERCYLSAKLSQLEVSTNFV